MKGGALQVPGIVHGTYPERLACADWPPQNAGHRLRAVATSLLRPDAGRYRDFAARVRAAAVPLPAQESVRARLARDGLTDAALIDAFRLIIDNAKRTLGLDLYDSQLIAARIMLDARLAEMATGEGKTLAIALGAAAAALAGLPVHVITANQYLVQRDAATLRPLYGALGLAVGAIEAAHDARTRRAQYACDITYCTASELAFDYLRDGLARGDARGALLQRAASLCEESADNTPLLRGLCMALVDEADSCLIDDAQVPLILARPLANGGRDAYYSHALELARRMRAPQHYQLERAGLQAHLSDSGRAALETWAAGLAPVWRNRVHREEALATALAALHLYRRDTHYLLREGKVALIDQSTGRVALGRAWSGGLHQLIELKEGLEVTAENETCAQITFQRLFRRYWRLGGMSGTLTEARRELRAIYELSVVAVPLHRPSRRIIEPTRLYASRALQFAAVLARVREAVASGRPVLIGTDSVADSHTLSALLGSAGLPHQVLNAHHEAAEAAIVAGAGAPGCVTVATNMAGRGTDIALGPGVAERGGLLLICCQHNAAARIDRQLIGRCARRGDPGAAVTLLCVKQPLFAALFPRWLARHLPHNGLQRPSWLIAWVVRLPQWLEERRAGAARTAMQKRDEAWESARPAGAGAE